MKNPEFRERQPATGARKQRPTGVPGKFSTEGAVQPFPGNTVVCHLSSDTGLFRGLMKLHRALQGDRYADLFSLLPPQSWHMTVFEGVCDQVRKPGYWPDDVPIDASLAECTTVFESKLSDFEANTSAPYRLRIAGYTARVDGIGLHLEPATGEEDVRLRDLRDRLSGKLNIRHPGHEIYVFHLSIAYFIRFPSDREREELDALLFTHLQGLPKTFELGAPEFCVFDDMFAFRRKFYLT